MFILKQNLLKFKFLIALSLFAIIIFTISGCANTKNGVSLDTKDTNENTEILTGKVSVKGKGVTITLTDNTNKELVGGIVTDNNIIEIVSILKKAGAEVIAVNDERLIATSKIKANKMMTTINNKDFKAPFVIKAIGDPKTLNDMLTKQLEYVIPNEKYIKIKIEKEDEILIPKYDGDIEFKYAKVAKE